MHDDLLDDGYFGEEFVDDDCQDDVFEEDDGSESGEEDWDDEGSAWPEPDESSSRPDMTKAVVLGAMIAGIAYEEVLLNSKNHKK